MKKKTSRQEGFSLVEIMIVVAIIGLLASVAIPNFAKARVTAQMNACISNLRQIDSAIQQWALDTKQDDPVAPVTTGDILPYLKESLVCPSGGKTFADSYSVTTLAAKPACLKMPATHKIEVPSQ